MARHDLAACKAHSKGVEHELKRQLHAEQDKHAEMKSNHVRRKQAQGSKRLPPSVCRLPSLPCLPRLVLFGSEKIPKIGRGELQDGFKNRTDLKLATETDVAAV